VLKNAGMLGAISNKLGPLSDQLTVSLVTLDSLMRNFNTLLIQIPRVIFAA